ncbi:unnamed protein product [Dicrocoelium dendriticum]|nr:unnamed protein product [Dicrocoelium dendriticum]
MRCLLEHGLSRLSDISNEQLRSTASTQFSRLLFHLDCLQDIVTAEELEESSSFSAFEANDRCYLLRGLVEMLRVFRDHSLLDVAVGYAHSQRFLATKVLMRRLPVTVGRHRLAIASSLCETVDPAMYVNPLLDLHFPVGDEPQYAVRKELEADAVDRLYSSFSLQLNRDWMLTDELNASNYLRRITPWLMKRTYQMEARSGLVSHAVTLLEKGSELCLKLKAKATDWVDSAICLDQLDLLCWEFSQFSKVIYRQHKGSERNTMRSTVSVDSHHGRPITLARFSLSHFLSLSLEDRVDMLLQCSFPGGKSISSIGTPVSHSVLVEWGQLILYINRVLSGSEVFIKRRRKQLLTHALLRSAVHNGFHLHRMLVELISAGTVDEIFSLDERCAKFLEPSSSVMAPSGECANIDLLKAIVEVIPSFRLVADTGSGMADRSSSNTAELPALRAYLKEVTSLITATSQCLAGLLSSTTLDIEACKQLESLSKQLRVIDQCASAMSDLLSLGASLGRYQHVVVGLGIMSVGELVRCGHDSGEFQKLLAHWICLLAKSILGELSHPNLSPDQRVDEGASSAQLTEYFGRLQTIFNKAFVGCPAADWISVGLHYSLLTAGDERLFEVSRHLHLDSLSPLRRSEEQSPGWYVSLLHALRNYIDSSLPEPSISPESKLQDMELMEPNERMARRCLLAFRTLSSSSSSKLHLQDLFDLEESILSAFSFIASVNPLMPSDTQPPITAPFQLRPLWTRSPSSLKRRQSLFLTAVFTIMQSFRSSHTNRNKFLNLLKSDSLYAVGRYFLLSAFDAADCLVQATFKYLAEYGDHLLPAEILERTMDLLINVVSGSTQSTWYNCAQWATHYSLHDKHDSCGLIQVDTKWTVLHGLFRIPRPFEANTELDDRPRFVLLTIETLRLLLSRLAYVHCPSDHMDEMLRMVAICGHRLDCAFNTSGADDRLYLPEILRPLSDMLSGIITDRIPWHCSSEEVSKAADKGLLLPFAYLSALSPTPNVVSNRIRRSLSPCSKGDCQLSAFELNWWKLFLRCWVADAHSTLALTELLSNGPSAMDARLRFCYALLEPKIAQLKLDSTLHTRLVDMYHCIWNCEPCDNVPSFQLVHPTSAERLRLALIVSSLGTNHSEILHAGACFPSGSHLVSSISMIESSNALSTATTWLRQQCLSAVYACLCVRTIICVSPIDLDLFNTAKSSQLDVIRHISRTHLKLGIRLAVCAHMPLYEAFCSRLDTLFLESSTSNTEAEIRRLMPWVLKAPDAHSRIIQWCSETIYPNLTDMYKLQILLDVLETEFQIAPPGDLPISVHRRIISLLKSNQSFMAELLDLPYAKLLNLLQSPMPYGLFRSHPLFEHLRTEPVLVTFSQILQLFPTGLESTLKSADLCAMYGLNVLSNSTSVANYRREQLSTLHSLLSGIAPSQDALDLERLVRWTHQLVFGPYGNCLEVDQRRWILKEVLCFIDGQGSSVSARILSDLEQFNRVSDKLKNLDFPVMRDLEANTDTAESVIAASSFFGAFLTLTPQDDVSASLLFRRLIDHVNTGDDLSPNSTFSYPCMETATQNLHWFATHLPTCFDAVRISSQVEVQLIVYAIASLPLPVSSPLDDILVKISNHAEHTSKSDRDSLSSALIEFIRSCFDKPSTLDDHRNPLSLEDVLSSLLVNTHIRRLHGPFLWHHFSTDTLDLKAATVFSAAFRLLSDSSGSCTEMTPASVLQGKLNSLQSSLSTEQFFEDTLMPLFQSTIDEMSSEQSTEPDSESLASSYRCDLLQSIIELFTLLFRIDSSSDEFSQNSQLTSSSNSTDPATVLWELWFQFTLHAKLLPDPDGFLTSTLLLEQWVHYGLPPPRGLALASIRHLRKCLHSSSTQWPISLQATVLSACLFQQDINVVLEALPVVAICSPSVIALIDPDACRCFTCLHGPVWVSLVKTDKTSAFALDPCPTLFTHIFQTVECFVSQHKSSTQAQLLCSHCVKHLHSADLWIEAIRLSRALCDFPVNVITLDTLVHRVCAMLKR